VRVTTEPKRPIKGRPRLPKELKRSHPMKVKVNDVEMAKICSQAKQRGMQPSVYLRERGLGLELPRPLGSDSLTADQVDAVNKLWLTSIQTRRDLSPVANNCNQLAAYSNAGRYQTSSVELMTQELQALLARFDRLASQAEQILKTVEVEDKVDTGADDDR